MPELSRLVELYFPISAHGIGPGTPGVISAWHLEHSKRNPGCVAPRLACITSTAPRIYMADATVVPR